MCRWELRWKVLLCGLYLRGQVWIARYPHWAGHCFDVWPSAIGEHFPAFSHWEITILSSSLGAVMNCLKKCFETLGSKISHVVGESIHCISCKGNTQCSGKLVTVSPCHLWDGWIWCPFHFAHVLRHLNALSPAMSPSLPQYRHSAYFEMVEADLLVHCPGFLEMVLPCWVSCWDVVRRAECS